MAGETEIRELLAQLTQLGAGFSNSRSNALAVGQAMARMRIEMQRGTGTVQQNAAALQRLAADFEGLDAATRRSSAGQAMLAEQTKMAGDIMRNAAGQMSGSLLKGGIVEAVEYFRTQFFTAIQSFQDGLSGTEAAFRQQNAAIDSQIRLLDKLSAGAGVAAETLALIPGPWSKLAAGTLGVISVLTGLGKEAEKLKQEGILALQKEVLSASTAYEAQVKSGVLFNRGVAQMYDGSRNLQLTFAEMTKTVSTNKKELAAFGGSVTGGYKRLVSVGVAIDKLGKEGEQLRESLYRAGYSYEEQADGIADYMTMLNASGQLNKKTSVDLARESAAYMINLKAISAFTGEDVKTAQARAKAASEQLAVQAKLDEMGPGAFERFQTAVADMGPEITKGLQQMTAFDGTIVDKGLNQLLAASPTRKKLLDETYADMQNKALTAAEVNDNYQRRVKEYGEALKQEALAAGKSYGAVTLATGAQSEVTALLEKQADLGRKGEAMKVKEIELLGTTVEQMDKLTKKGVDPLTEALVTYNTKYRQDMTAMSTAMQTAAGVYATQPGKAGPDSLKLRESQQLQMADTIAILQKILPDVIKMPNIFEEVRKAYGVKDKPDEVGSMSKVVQGLTAVADGLSTTVGQLGRIILEIGKIPFKATGGVTQGLTFAGEAGPELIMPMADGNKVNFKFPDIENYFNELGSNKTATDPESVGKMIAGAFDNPNLMTNSLNDLKSLISADSQMSQNLMKQYTEKMDTLIASSERMVDYSKRIADGIA